MPPAWYQQPVFYFSNPNSIVGNELPVFAPAGCNELDYELELGAFVGPGNEMAKSIPIGEAEQHIGELVVE